MKTTILLFILLFTSACLAYEAATTWNDETLAGVFFACFTIFWAAIICNNLRTSK